MADDLLQAEVTYLRGLVQRYEEQRRAGLDADARQFAAGAEAMRRALLIALGGTVPPAIEAVVRRTPRPERE